MTHTGTGTMRSKVNAYWTISRWDEPFPVVLSETHIILYIRHDNTVTENEIIALVSSMDEVRI